MPVKFLRKHLRTGFLGLLWSWGIATGAAEPVSVVWRDVHSSTVQTLKTWSDSDFSSVKLRTYKDSQDSWTGALLSELIQKGLGSLPADKKATVDLILLSSRTGEQVLIPRYVIVKYPVLLAHRKNGKPISEKDGGPFLLWISGDAAKKIAQEGLPVERFTLPKVMQIEPSNYQARFGTYFLKRRTDPAAMRGEKLFVQSCLACHFNSVIQGSSPHQAARAPQQPWGKNREVSLQRKHPAISGVPSFNERDWRALSSYFEAYQTENPQLSVAVGSGSK